MIQTNIFKSNKTQAVRLPKAVAMPDDVKEVDVIKVGNRRIICKRCQVLPFAFLIILLTLE
jgi:virulence-associated protein VagC